MFCAQCGKGIPDGAKFCPTCGAAAPGEGKPASAESPRTEPAVTPRTAVATSNLEGAFLGSAVMMGLIALVAASRVGEQGFLIIDLAIGAVIYMLGYRNLKEGRIQAAKTTALVIALVACFGVFLNVFTIVDPPVAIMDAVVVFALGYAYSKL